MSVGKPAPRFLPTLTEVIRPAKSVVRAEASVESVENMLQRVVPAVQAQLRETVTLLVQEHARLLEARLQQEIELAVKRAIALEIASHISAADPPNP